MYSRHKNDGSPKPTYEPQLWAYMVPPPFWNGEQHCKTVRQSPRHHIRLCCPSYRHMTNL